MKSKTKITKQLKKKNNPNLVETIFVAKKNESWKKVAEILTSPRRKKVAMNLEKINEFGKDGETVVVPGKVLSQGSVEKKIKIVASEISDMAKEKLSKSKIEFSYIKDEIKKNPDMKNMRILTENEK